MEQQAPKLERPKSGRKMLSSAFRAAFGLQKGKRDSISVDKEERPALVELSKRWAAASSFADCRWGWMGVQGWDTSIWLGSTLSAAALADYDPQLMRSTSACRQVRRPSGVVAKADGNSAPSADGEVAAGLTFAERALQKSQLRDPPAEPGSPMSSVSASEDGRPESPSSARDAAPGETTQPPPPPHVCSTRQQQPGWILP